MIIKLIPVKTKAKLSAVIQYIASDKGRKEDHKGYGIFHNLKHQELESLRNEIAENYDTYASSRTKNIVLHGIVSFHPEDRDKVDEALLDDIVTTLLEKAFPYALAYGEHHLSENHRHSHFIVSSNELMSKTSTRLSRQQLFETHKYMIEYVNEKYPDLKKSFDLSQWGRKIHNEKEYYMKKRNPEIKLTREDVKERVHEILSFSRTSKDFFTMLEFEGFQTYMRNDKVQGILFGEKEQKMRLSRLGIEQELLDEMDKWNERLEELGKKNPHAKEAILEEYFLGPSPKEIYTEIEKYEEEEKHKEITTTTALIDHYTYHIDDMSGNPTGINPNLSMETDQEFKLEDRTIDTPENELEMEFSRVMNFPIHVEGIEIDAHNEFTGDTTSDLEDDKTYNVNDVEPENDVSDTNDLENDADNDIDADNDMDMESEP